MTRFTLKEVFLREQQGPDSRFVSSMRKQFARTDDLDWMADIYDRILQLAAEPDANKRQEALRHEEPIFKFHFRIAYQEMQQGKLDPSAVPSGKEIVEAELEKRHAHQAAKEAERQRNLAAQKPMTPQQKADAELRAVYGGDPNDPRVRRSGLGS